MEYKTATAETFAKARQTLAGAAAIRQVRRLRGPSQLARLPDFASEQAPSASPSDSAALIYHLTYADADGQDSTRVVTLRRIDPDRNGLKLLCWCHAANSVRQFRVDRVREVFCIITGEVFDDAQHYFTSHPMLNSPRDPEAYALSVCKHEVNLLTILAASDGHVHEAEMDRIIMHVWDRVPHLNLNQDILRLRLSKLVPDVAAFDAALLRIGKFKDGDPVALKRSMRKLVDADGHLTAEEIEFVTEIQQRLVGAFKAS